MSVVCVHGIHVYMRCCAEIEGTLLYRLFLLFGESAGIHHYGMHFKTFFVLEIRDAERGVETSAECEHYFIVLHDFSDFYGRKGRFLSVRFFVW